LTLFTISTQSNIKHSSLRVETEWAADGEGVVSHAGSRLLADVADRTTLDLVATVPIPVRRSQ
jgi:hypothetical protein